MTPTEALPGADPEAPGSYGAVAKGFHWIVFALIVAQYVVAYAMPHIGRKTQPVGLVYWHLSLGAVILVLVVARLGWRLTHPVAPYAQGVAPWMHITATITHRLIYAVLLIMPLLGWANASTRGFPVSLFSLVPLPKVLPTGMKNGGTIGDVHSFIAWYVLIPLVVLHVAAALYHHFALRDGVLRRMLPARS